MFKDKRRYPFIGKSIASGTVVKFTSEREGRVLQKTNACYYVGEYRDDWIINNFVRYVPAVLIGGEIV